MILPPRVEELVASLMRRIEALEAENAELRRRLDLDSSNSSTRSATPISLRELQAVCELDKEPWAEVLRATLLDANEAVRNAKAQGTPALAPETIKGFEDRYWAAVREGLALHRSLPAFDPSMNPQKTKEAAPRSQSPHPVQNLQGGDQGSELGLTGIYELREG
jgi:hypothetical protein